MAITFKITSWVKDNLVGKQLITVQREDGSYTTFEYPVEATVQQVLDDITPQVAIVTLAPPVMEVVVQ